MTEPTHEEVVLVLSQEEHDYLFRLLLDYGAYHRPNDLRVPLAKKLTQASPVRDVPMPTAPRLLDRTLDRLRALWRALQPTRSRAASRLEA